MFSKETLDRVKLAKQYVESTGIIRCRQISRNNITVIEE